MQNSDKKTFAHILITLSLLLALCTLPGVFAITSTLFVPATASEGAEVSITFSADNPNATFALYHDNVLVTTTSPYLWQTDYEDAGIHTFRLETPGASNQEETIEILDVPLAVTVQEPSQSEYAQQTLPIALTTNVAVDFCYYVLGAQSNTLTANGLEHTGSVIASDGAHTLELKCKKGTTLVQQDVVLLVDTQAPIIESFAPATNAALQASSATLQVTTDELAQCFYWEAGQPESTKKQFTANDGLTHTAIVTGQKTHSYDVRCQDIYANAMTTTQVITFGLNTPPSAEIEIIVDGEEYAQDIPLRQGAYDVIVRTNEEVSTTPVLKYTYQNGGSGTVALEQDIGNIHKWEGFLSIPQTPKEDVASFTISLKDTTEVIGTQITKGSIFLVDTVLPKPVTQPKAQIISQNSKPSIRLTWVDTQQEQDITYVIYRSIYDRVTTSDALLEVETTMYVDTSIQEGQTYYYAIAPKDVAGNSGELSKTVTATTTPTTSIAKDPQKGFAVTELTTKLAKGILDLETTKSTLEQEKNTEKLVIIEQAGLLEDVEVLLESLKIKEETLESLAELSTTTFTQEVAQINDLLAQVNGVIPNFITIDAVNDFAEPNDIRAQGMVFERIIDIFPSATHLLESAQEKIAYQNDMQELMQETRVNGKVVIATVVFSDRKEKGFTSVAKQITLPGTKEFTLIELLPREFAEQEIAASQIQWSQEPTILPSEDMALFIVPQGKNIFSYEYFIEQKIPLTQAKATRAVLLPEPSAATIAPNSITGNFISQSLQGGSTVVFYGLAIFLVAGLLVYYFFMDAAALPQGATQFSQGSLEQLAQAITQAVQTSAKQQPPVQEQFFYKKTVPKALGRAPQEFFTRRKMEHPFAASARTVLPDALSPAQRLAKAHAAIDTNAYIDAKELYLSTLQEKTSQDPAFLEQTQSLYYKLLLYKQLRLAESAMQEEDATSLTKHLEQVKIIAQKIPQTPTPLTLQAQEQYKVFTRLANKLAIEQNTL